MPVRHDGSHDYESREEYRKDRRQKAADCARDV